MKLAQLNDGSGGIVNPAVPGLGDPSQTGGKFAGFIMNFFTVILILGALFMFFQLVQGGFRWITSNGEKGNIESARNQIQHAILGLFILAASWIVFIIVISFLGIGKVGESGGIIFNFPALFGE